MSQPQHLKAHEGLLNVWFADGTYAKWIFNVKRCDKMKGFLETSKLPLKYEEFKGHGISPKICKLTKDTHFQRDMTNADYVRFFTFASKHGIIRAGPYCAALEEFCEDNAKVLPIKFTRLHLRCIIKYGRG